MSVSEENKRIAIVGGGMAGVTAARRLASAGADVTVLEKSRGLGGRLATRRMDGGYSADHGAQFLAAEKQPFRAFLKRAVHAGSIAEWNVSSDTDGWYIGTPAMNSFLKTEPLGFDLRVSTHVSAVSANTGEVKLTLLDGSTETFDKVIITTPAPQTVAMLNDAHANLAGALAGVEIAPNWTLMLVFSEPLNPGFTFWTKDHGVLGWIARNSSKPGRDFAADSWTVQASADWSTKHLEIEKEQAGEQLFQAFQGLVGFDLPEAIVQTAHRWRYARTTTPLGKPFLSGAHGRIYIAGDWCLGAGVECAFESGLAAASDVLSR